MVSMLGPVPIPIRKAGVTAEIREAINTACRSIYKDRPFKIQVAAYAYESFMMYSISAYSNSSVSPLDINFDAVKSGFVGSSLEFGFLPTDIVLGKIAYTAPSSVKFMITVRT